MVVCWFIRLAHLARLCGYIVLIIWETRKWDEFIFPTNGPLIPTIYRAHTVFSRLSIKVLFHNIQQIHVLLGLTLRITPLLCSQYQPDKYRSPPFEPNFTMAVDSPLCEYNAQPASINTSHFIIKSYVQSLHLTLLWHINYAGIYIIISTYILCHSVFGVEPDRMLTHACHSDPTGAPG